MHKRINEDINVAGGRRCELTSVCVCVYVQENLKESLLEEHALWLLDAACFLWLLAKIQIIMFIELFDCSVNVSTELVPLCSGSTM